MLLANPPNTQHANLHTKHSLNKLDLQINQHHIIITKQNTQHLWLIIHISVYDAGLVLWLGMLCVLWMCVLLGEVVCALDDAVAGVCFFVQEC